MNTTEYMLQKLSLNQSKVYFHLIINLHISWLLESKTCAVHWPVQNFMGGSGLTLWVSLALAISRRLVDNISIQFLGFIRIIIWSVYFLSIKSG